MRETLQQRESIRFHGEYIAEWQDEFLREESGRVSKGGHQERERQSGEFVYARRRVLRVHSIIQTKKALRLLKREFKKN
jgi:hypothetical protein